MHVPRYYYPKEVTIKSIQLHGFSDVSESAYFAVVYVRIIDAEDDPHIALVSTKNKVALLKRLTIS